MKKLLLMVAIPLLSYIGQAQVGINNTDPKSTLDISATNVATPSNTDGILIPRIDDFPVSDPIIDQNGMMVFVTGNGVPSKGFYYWDQGTTAWVSIGGGVDTQNTLDEAYDEGGAGAGNIINATDGALQIAGEDGLLVTGTLGSGDVVSISGAGARMFFNPNKAAFRAGFVNSTQWNESNIGLYSVGLGTGTRASGDFSVAIGSSVATQNYASALGWGNQATGFYAMALGQSSTASGWSSTVLGRTSTASGDQSMALGQSVIASGDFSTALGYLSNASGYASNTFGYNLTAPSGYETVIGNFNTVYTPNNTLNIDPADRLFVVGNGTSNALRSNALTIYKDGTLNINDAYNMPLTDGATGQVMTTDGSGNISFITPAITGVNLDQAYDYGGPGNGRNINADSGAVDILGAGGLRVGGDITVGANIIHDLDLDTSISFTPDRIEIDAGGVNYIDIENTNSEITINEGSNAINFRVESDNENNMLLVHGTNNAIGIGENNPNSPLEIGIETPFDLNVANSGQDGIFIIGNNGSGLNGIGGSISFGGAHSARKNSRRAAISSLQTGTDEDNVGLAFYIHQGPVNTNPMVEGMRLTHQRYLGINNSSPSANLDVIGTMQFEDGNESAGFVLASDASGNATWTDPSSLSISDDDWVSVGGNIERQLGDVYIGDTNATNNDLYLSDRLVDWDDLTYFVDPAGDTRMNEIQFDNGTAADPSIRFSDVDTGFYSPSNGTTAYSANGSEAFIIQSNGKITFGSAVSSTYDIYMKNSFNSKILSIGANNTDNNPLIDASISGDAATSIINANVLSANRNFSHAAIKTTSQIGDVYASISENVGNRVYGFRSIISEDNTIGDKIGVYSEATKVNSYAGYFLGRVSIGTTAGNIYTLPASRGTNGQIMETDASGNVSWANPISDTDNQTIDNLGILGDTLGISLEDDGQAIQTVNLSNVSFNVSNFALAKMNMSALQILPVSAWTKLNFDATDFDIDTSFNSTTDRFEVADAGYYQISASYRSTTNILTNDLFGISVYVNGAAVRTEIINHYGSGVIVRNVKTIESLSVGDYIEIYHFSNVALTVTNSTLYTTFEVERIR